MAEQFSIPTVGDLIAGKYRVEEELGRGAYGVVFRAEQEELGRNVAVKTLLPQAFLQQDIVQRFHREARLIGSLDHANIIRLWDYGVDEGLLYMAVEYVEGRTLMDLIDNDAPLEPARVRHLALQMLDALDHAHAMGIVHRDLKPENIILVQTKTTDGREYEVVKILDFGISKLLRGDGEHQNALKSLTQDGTVLGTPHYMSPENIVGDPIDHRADLYAFGVILYEMLTGTHPFDAPSPSAVMVRHLRDDPPEMPAEFTDTALGEAIRQCLEKQPWDRVESAQDLIDLLETDDSEIQRVSQRPSSGYRQPMVPPGDVSQTIVQEPGRAKREPTKLYAALALIFLILSISIGWKLWLVMQENDDAPAEPVVTVTDPVELPEDPVIIEAEDAGMLAFGVDEADAGDALALGEPDAGSGDAGAAGIGNATASDPNDQRRPKEPRERREPREPREPKPEEKIVELIQVDITSVPKNANVTIDGVPVGSTPIRRKLVLEKAVEVRFSHIGYKEKVMQVTPAEGATAIRAELKRDHFELN